MKEGDTIKATWDDGLELVGKYSKKERGYVILIDENNKPIVCNPSYVRFVVINESR